MNNVHHGKMHVCEMICQCSSEEINKLAKQAFVGSVMYKKTTRFVWMSIRNVLMSDLWGIVVFTKDPLGTQGKKPQHQIWIKCNGHSTLENWQAWQLQHFQSKRELDWPILYGVLVANCAELIHIHLLNMFIKFKSKLYAWDLDIHSLDAMHFFGL